MKSLLAALNTPTRLKLIDILSQREELQIKELVTATSFEQAVVSQNLIVLEQCGIIGKRKERTSVYCSLTPSAKTALKKIIGAVQEYEAAVV